MQDDFADSHENVYVEKNGYIDVNIMKDGVSVAIGTDEYHWNQSDAVLIGKMAGELILDKILNFNK